VLTGYNLSATSFVFKEAREIDGDYYGLTPDWETYTRMSKWASDNLPAGLVVARRKPSISRMYGPDGNFYGIMSRSREQMTMIAMEYCWWMFPDMELRQL
jgi:hypothetical protein